VARVKKAGDDVGYDAFISYSHAADGMLAPRLQLALQRFAKPWWRRRSLRVFRDETGLAVNQHLWLSITDAMDESEWFILLASEEAASSQWIDREIAYWREHKDPSRILPVVTSGAWQWSNAAHDFDWATSTAVPAALARAFIAEPRHLDLRWAHADEQLDLRNGRFRGDVAQLAAAIHGIPKDELEGEDVRQHRRTLRWAWGAAVALVLLTMLSAGTALAAVRNADEAQRNEASAIAAEAQAASNAEEAAANASQAQQNAEEADEQRSMADDNAARATRSQTEAEQQRELAESNAREAAANASQAQQNADKAAANATEAQQNADEAAANAARAQQNAEEAAANAAQAQQNATRANLASAEATRSAQESAELAASVEAANETLRQTNDDLEQQTRVAISRQLAATALAKINTDHSTALLHAAAANKIEPTLQARDSLLRAVVARPETRVQFRSPNGTSIGVVVSRDGDTIATANIEGGGDLWDAATGAHRATIPRELGQVFGASFDASHRVVARTMTDALVLDATTGTILTQIPAPFAGPAFAFSPVAITADGNSLALVTTDEDQWVIERWNVASAPTLVERIPLPSSNQVQQLELSADGSALAWTQDDDTTGTALYVRRDNGITTGPLRLNPADPPIYSIVADLVFSPDGQLLESVSPNESDSVVIWDLTTGERVSTWAPAEGVVVAGGSNQGLVAVVTDEGSLTFHDARTGRQIGSPATIDPASLQFGAHLFVHAFSILPDDSGIVVLEPEGARVVDVNSRPRQLGVRSPSGFAPSSGESLSEDGRLLAIIRSDQSLAILETATGRVVREVREASVSKLGSFDPRGAFFSYLDNGSLNVLSVADGTIEQLVGPHLWLGNPGVAFSPDGTTVATIVLEDDGTTITTTLRLWRRESGRWSAVDAPVLRAEPEELAFSSDGTLAVQSFDLTTGDTWIELITPGRPNRFIEGVRGTLRFSPDGRVLAVQRTELAGDRIILFAMPTGTPLGAPITMDSQFSAVAMDSAGGFLVTAGYDGIIQLWDLATANPIGPPLTGHTNAITALAFSGPGQLISAAPGFTSEEATGEVMTWDLSQERLVALACTLANRDMTEAEWTQLVGTAVPYIPICPASG
jgi:WD40 repeat protein